jgi:hypothetical protein
MLRIKRFLALIIVCLALGSGPALAGLAIINGGGTGGLIAQGSNNSTITTVTSAPSTVDVPANSFVFIAETSRSTNGGFTSCTDSAGNSYSSGANKSNPPTAQTLQWNYGITANDAPIGTTWTCTAVVTTAKGIMVAAFSGAAATPHDAASATPTAGNGTVMSVGPTGTLSCPGGGANCEVLLAAWSNHNTGAQSAQTAGFTQFGCIANGTNFANICMAYEIVSATTAQSYTSTNANSDVWAMALEAFKASTAAAPSAHPLFQSVP